MAKLTRQQFIEKLAPYAIEDMRKNNIPASLTIAQGILESANGNSTLTVKANNLFGIKGKGSAGSVEMKTTEYVNGKPVSVMAKFRAYNNWGESVADHSRLFLDGVSWNKKLYHGVIGKDGITACYEVAKAGYATDPKYADKLISLINDNNLLQYDVLEAEQQKPDEIIIRLVKLVDTMHDRLAKAEAQLLQIPAPEWFVKEFPTATELINQKTGTLEFWRGYAVTLRIMKEYKII